MSSLLIHLESISHTILNTLRRFPLVVLSAYLMTTILVALTAMPYGGVDQYPYYLIADKIAFVALLGIPLFLVLHLLSKGWWLPLLGLVAVGIYYQYIPDNFEQEAIIMTRHVLVMVALSLFVVVAPVLFRSMENRDFWAWVQQLLFSLLLALIFGVVLYLGISGAIYAVGMLFEITIPSRLYAEIAIVIFGLITLLYFLSQIPEDPAQIKARPYSKIEKIFTQSILTPLSLLYFVILYAYTLKILLFAQLPSGKMAWLILIFSLVAMVTLLFWTPLWSVTNNHYRRWVWLAILFLIPLLALSIYLRIEQYGITEHRYYIVLMGGWLLMISLLFLVVEHASYKWIFGLLAGLILFSQLGAYSAYRLAKQSQTKQLQTLLDLYRSTQEHNRTLHYQLSDKLHYLYEQHGIASLESILPTIVDRYQHEEENRTRDPLAYHYFPEYAADQLGFEYINAWEWHHQKTPPVSKM